MAQLRDSQIRRSLTTLIAPRRVRALARELGVVRRRRKVDVVALVYALVLGYAASAQRSLAGLRRAYQQATARRLAPSAFYDRFSVRLARLLKQLVHESLQQLAAQRPRLQGVLRTFEQVLVADGTVIRLHEALAPAFPSVWTHHMPASAKLHVVMNAVGRGPSRVRISQGRRQDIRLLQVGRWIRDKLLIFDLGYFHGGLFHRIDQHGGFFLSRMREPTNPVIVESHRPEDARFVGKTLRSVLTQISHDPLDLQGRLSYRNRRRTVHHTVSVRIVGVWNDREHRYHLYVTNIPSHRLGPEHLSAVYAARWEVELLFRELKSHYRLRDVRSRRRSVTECLIYASLLTLAVSRALHRLFDATRRGLSPQLPLDRGARLFRLVSLDLLDLLVGPAPRRRFLSLRIRRLLIHEAPDPNRHRLLLPARAQLAILAHQASC